MRRNAVARKGPPIGSIVSVARAFRIIEQLADAAEGLTFTEIVSLLKVNKAIAFKLLNTLASCGYVFRNDRTGNYCLTFRVSNVSLRKLDWDSMRVNFFVIATPGLLANAPTSYITSFHLPAGQASFNNRLSQRFPNMTVVDMSAIMRQVQGVMEENNVRALPVISGGELRGIVTLEDIFRIYSLLSQDRRA